MHRDHPICKCADEQVEVSDIFEDEVEKQSRITILFETLWMLRSKIIKEREIKTN